jgi:hypothetical protein
MNLRSKLANNPILHIILIAVLAIGTSYLVATITPSKKKYRIEIKELRTKLDSCQTYSQRLYLDWYNLMTREKARLD